MIGLSLSLALGLGEEEPGGKARAPCVPPGATRPPTACLLQGLEPPLGEEVQSVTNWAIFITAVTG